MEPFNAAAFFVDRHVAEGRGMLIAHRAGGQLLTRGEIAENANRWGNALGELGVASGQRVLLILDDTPAFVAVFWGTVKVGAVAVPVNPLMSAGEYEFVLHDSGATVVVVEARVVAKILQVRDGCPDLRAIVVVGGRDAGTLALDETLERAMPTLAPTATDEDDVMYWGYTSGSTGRPKAAVHSHAHFRAAAALVGVGVFGLSKADVVFSASKLYFSFGLG